MAPKQEISKKNKKAKADRAVEDQTFGLKNKNKSAKVKTFIDRVEKGVKHSTGALDAEAAKDAKKALKLTKQLQEEELRILFNEGIANQFGKKKSTAAEKAASLGITQQNEEIARLLDEFSSDSDDDNPRDNEKRPTLYLSDDDEPVEVFREKTIEDLIEEQRAKLHSEGKQGTPVTEESFRKWRTEKLAKKQAEAEARMKAEATKKGKGKALSVLSGKELFNYDATLFVDDEAAINKDEENFLSAETAQDEAAEQARVEAEEARAREEQNRLMEARRLEVEAKQYRDDERRRVAALRETMFQLGSVMINEAVFIEEDDEDLDPFEFDDSDDDDDEDDDEEEDDEEEDEDEDEVGEEGGEMGGAAVAGGGPGNS